MPNLTGQSIGRYHILEQLGEGGMATVYKAYDTRLERNVALKVLRTDQFIPAQLQMVLQRFEREAKSLAKLKHSNIVNILDFGEHEEMPYLVMEYLPGGTLKQKLGRAIPWREAIQTLLPVARGISYAHQRGIIHRDVKPANVLIDENEDPILTDFGIAKLLEGTSGHTLTASGVGIGTPEYMAPEQGIGASTIDARADIYSLGIILFEMVTGRKPYIADTPMAVVLKQMTDPLPRPTEFVPDLPEGVEQILFKALAKQPEDRYTDMNALISAMVGVLQETQKIEVSAPTKQVEEQIAPRPKPSPKVIMAIAGILAVILAVSFVVPWAMKQLSVVPDAEVTSTKSADLPASTSQPNQPTATPSTNSVAIGTAQVPIESVMVYFSIMDYITNTPPDFKDDFSEENSSWLPIAKGVSTADVIKYGALDLSLDTENQKDRFELGSESMRATNFALEFDLYFEDGMGGTSLGIGFPSTGKDGKTYSDVNLDLENQKWFIGFTDGTVEYRGETSEPLKGKWSHVQLIYFDTQIGFFLNDTFLGNAEGVTHSQNEIWIYAATGGQGHVILDNIKFWNLDEAELSTPTANLIPETKGAFYIPILSYLAEGQPTFQDDMSAPATDGGGVWETPNEGSLWAENGYRLVKKNEPSMEMTFPIRGQFNATDFAIQYDAAFVHENPLDGFGIYFRTSSDLNANYKILITSSDKRWVLSQGDGIIVNVLDTGRVEFDPYMFNTFLLIAKQENFAFFVNGNLIVERNDIETSGIQNILVATARTSKRELKLDNLKFWNLNGLEIK